MLMLVFSLGQDRYAIESGQVVEVVPMVNLRKIPRTPDYVAGLFNYRGLIVPVIDLCYLTRGYASHARFSTRIILVNYPGADHRNHILGLLAERVTDTVTMSEAGGADPGLKVEDAPYLGDILTEDRGIIQCVRVQELLPESLRASLFVHQEGRDNDAQGR